MQPNAPVTSVVMGTHHSTRRSVFPGRSSRIPRLARLIRALVKGSVLMPDRPFVVLAGNIHPAGRAVLDREARVLVCDEEGEAPFVKAAAEADGILFRVRPRCTESLMGSCGRLRVVGRHGVGLDTVDIPAATKLGVAV